MDDPLIGLTIYDSTVQAHAVLDSENPAESNQTKCSFEASATGTTRKQSKKVWKVGVDDANEECFPCLPGISEDQHNELAKPGEADAADELDASHPNEGDGLQSFTSKEKLDSELQIQQSSQPKNYWLMRLFQSNLFTMSIGVGYLFNSKDHDVLSYLGDKIFVSVLTPHP